MEDFAQTIKLLKAIGDPVRLEIVRQMADVSELACQTLEKRLSVSKPTISHHIRVLAQAGLVGVRREGRYFFYTLDRDVLRGLADELRLLAARREGLGDSERSELWPDSAENPPDVELLAW